MHKICFFKGEKNKLTKDGDSLARFEINTDKLGNSWELERLLEDKLGKFTKEIEIDYESFKNLSFKNFGAQERDLALSTVLSMFTTVAFTMKSSKNSEKDVKKWKLVGGNFDSNVSSISSSFALTKRLQSTPPNIMTPEQFVLEAREALKGIPGVEIEEIKGEDLKKERLELIIAVGKASINAPRLLIIKYLVSGSDDLIALVGKGVCYDTGGLNIKTGSYMATMKFDMSGAAVSLGVVKALAENGSKQSVVVAIPLVENSVAGNSYRPDDVIICRNGMSIEIDNTDAEGRLVLADALAYVSEVYKPKEIITIATLTGAIGYALGSKYGGAWSTNDDQWNKLRSCSLKAAEWIWRMPMDDYYLKALQKTKVADIKNSAKTGMGGSNRAAMFLKEFTNNIPFIHLDIASIDHCENTGEPRAPLLKTLYFYLFG
ncbi:M17 family metallopeptidase [Candidatus Mycoplasma haematohominis]|uniref:M17 family metallopeptidase n=1 Tax=Candidatus Mycoplasma haematohominis TaxID=1494318 RepID=UPI001C0A72D3|nr:M17 family metallopeptidase [Candidatus Mycoplasma haemohominis]